jgi:hypothetical protein
MTIVMRAIASIVLCTALMPALAEQTQLNTTAPSEAELLKWKNDVLDRYQHVVYLNAERSPISEADFLRELREHRAAFSMTHEPGNFDQIVVRLLRPDEIKK